MTAAVLLGVALLADQSQVAARQAQGAPIIDEEQLAHIADLATAASAGDAAFLASGINAKTGEVIVYRVGGDQPAAVTSRYSSLSTSVIPVRVRPAAISREQAEVLRKALDKDLASLRAEGIEIQYYGPAGDGVFEIGVLDAQRHEETLLQRYGGFGRQAVRLVDGEVVSLVGRQNDSAAWYGGGRLYRVGAVKPRDGCTTGFGARSLANADVEYVFMAHHCLNLSDRRVFNGGPGSGTLIGSVSAVLPAHDVDAIFVTSSLNISWDGPWNSTTHTKRITRQVRPSNGRSLCTSGSYSGIRCGGRVDSSAWTTVVHRDSNGNNYTAKGWWTIKDNGTNLGGFGDSGAPVWQNHSDGTGVAMGHIQAGWTGAGAQVACTGYVDIAWRRCFNRVFISDIVDIVNQWSLSVTLP
jgi:hypothetical protein